MARAAHTPGLRDVPKPVAVDRSADIAAPVAIGPKRASGALLLCFTATLFVSATLLFMIQPMVGKMILPALGGTPAVWNTCMLFFQVTLLAGYAYAHVTTAWLGVRRQSAFHLIVILIPLAALPIVLSQGTPPPASGNPVVWLLTRLLVCAGLPFFVISTTGPLLQKWFAGTGHPSAKDPYFLYAASNLGSLIALLGYPLVLQPAMALTEQSLLWSWGYAGLVAMIGVCTLLVWRSPVSTAVGGSTESTDVLGAFPIDLVRPSEITGRRRMWWVLASFVPSSLMLGVTAHITSNLAPVPLLWVLPLAVYLLTFVLVFSKRRPVPHSLVVRVLPLLILPLAVLTNLELPNMGWVAILAHLTTFFVAAMVCHGELANTRPSAKHLTEFYLWVSIGGALGGVFNAMIAPAVFSTVVEYPLAIMLSCLLLPRLGFAGDDRRARTRDFTFPLILASVAAGLILGVQALGLSDRWAVRASVLGPLAMLCFSFKDRPIRFTLGLGVFFVAMGYYCGLQRGSPLHVGRNFFGVKRVLVDSDAGLHKLIHGTTNHGMQFTDPARSREPLAYYHRQGPLGDIFAEFSGPDAKSTVAIVGLGAGAIASYAEPGHAYTFYEIDPAVERIARDPKYFTFLDQCRGACDVVLGDGRLTLAGAPDQYYEFIVLDAFSSDAIPTHLLTREALRLYVSKLAEDGLLAFHISNGYLDLERLLATLAADAGLVGLYKRDLDAVPDWERTGKEPSHYVALARRAEHFGRLTEHPDWKPLLPTPGTPLWTDQQTSILKILCWR